MPDVFIYVDINTLNTNEMRQRSKRMQRCHNYVEIFLPDDKCLFEQAS